jgi:hypothetical protein
MKYQKAEEMISTINQTSEAKLTTLLEMPRLRYIHPTSSLTHSRIRKI